MEVDIALNLNKMGSGQNYLKTLLNCCFDISVRQVRHNGDGGSPLVSRSSVGEQADMNGE